MDSNLAKKSWVSLIFVFFLFFGQASAACDDAFLNLITGKNPSEEFGKSLLKMSGLIRDMAGDLAAFNDRAANQKLNDLMKMWVNFDNAYSQKPPAIHIGDPGWAGKLKFIADMLGSVRQNLQGERLAEAHDLLEPMVCRLSLLGFSPQARKNMGDFLNLEISFYSLKPGFKADSREILLDELGSFSKSLSLLESRFPPDLKVKQTEFRRNFDVFNGTIASSTVFRSPRQLVLFKKLMENLMGIKNDLIANGWFEK